MIFQTYSYSQVLTLLLKAVLAVLVIIYEVVFFCHCFFETHAASQFVVECFT